MNYSDRLKAARKHAKLTQAQLNAIGNIKRIDVVAFDVLGEALIVEVFYGYRSSPDGKRLGIVTIERDALEPFLRQAHAALAEVPPATAPT